MSVSHFIITVAFLSNFRLLTRFQFLNSVLSSIGTDNPKPPPVQTHTTSQNNKRKAEEDIASSNPKPSKAVKSDHSQPALVPASRPPMTNGKPSASHPTPYRGISKPIVSSAPSPAPAAEAAKQPKKGSYKEIMARAQAAAAQQKAPIGTISHKPKDKMEISYKKEQKLKKKALRDKKLGIVKDNSRPSSSDGHRSSSPAPGKAASSKKMPQPMYAGTAKPKPLPTYKGTLGAKEGKKPSAKPVPKRRANEYAATDDELDSEEDEVEGDGYGYSDEESEDMEAGFSDVEQEETVAAKVARKEDEEEARLEAMHRKEKEERRKKLEMMAKKAKPQRY